MPSLVCKWYVGYLLDSSVVWNDAIAGSWPHGGKLFPGPLPRLPTLGPDPSTWSDRDLGAETERKMAPILNDLLQYSPLRKHVLSGKGECTVWLQSFLSSEELVNEFNRNRSVWSTKIKPSNLATTLQAGRHSGTRKLMDTSRQFNCYFIMLGLVASSRLP